VEGYAVKVLEGGRDILRRDSLKAIIVEIWKKSMPQKILKDFGFRAYNYNPFTRDLFEIDTAGKNDVIFLRDIKFIKARLKNAASFKVFSNEI
jgi:hypothetical protein